MQAADDGAGGAEGGGGAPAGSGGPREPGGRDGSTVEGTASGGAPEARGASLSSARGEEASALASGEASDNQQLELDLLVPFLCYMDAEVARHVLTSGAEPFHGAVQTEFTMVGSDLLIKVTAEDPALLQTSTASLLNHLTLIVQNMQPFVPPFCAKPWPGKGG